MAATTLNEEHRTRAITKLRKELAIDIGKASEVARDCGVWELLRLCYLLRLTRITLIVPHYRNQLSHADLAEHQLRDEALKYAISLVAKYGRWADDGAAISSLKSFNNSRVVALEYFARHINSKFETESLLHFADVQVSGERDQECRLDLGAALKDPQRAIYMHYGFRIEQATMRKKDKMLSVEEVAERMRIKYSDVVDLFASETGVSLDKYCDGMQALGESLKERCLKAEDVSSNEHGRIDPDAASTFVAMAMSMFFSDAELEKTLTSEFIHYLRQHPFEAGAVSNNELRFHYLSRRPYLIGNGFAILSPDLIFDSVLINAHFTMLESEESKSKYMELSSKQFIDRVAAVAAQWGYQETGRDIYLKEGKREIGDIDLVLTHEETGHTLLVEGKNHSLPLPVYFRDPQALEEHTTRTKDWQKKVQRRIDHLKANNASSYSVAGQWNYLIVTEMPEPLSHVSDVLVLCIEEFEYWLAQESKPAHFSDFYQMYYAPEQVTMSLEEMQRLQSEGYILPRLDA